jgi:DNA polymerase (family 10)
MNNNRELAKIFSEIAVLLEMKEGRSFRSLAFEKAAFGLETLSKDVREIYAKESLEGLEKIPGVGKSIAEKIEEYLKTGKVGRHRQLKSLIPINLGELLAVEGLGPRMTYTLYQKLKVKNLKQLEAAAISGKIRCLPNFGEKTEANILQGIEFVKRSQGRFLLGEILPEIQDIAGKLKSLKEVEEISLAGSLRRRKETIGDADLLVISKNSKRVTDFFVSLPGVVKIWGQGTTKASIRMKRGFDIDLRIIPKKSYGAALQYFTGSKEHNIVLRQMAIEKGLKLNEYGLFRGDKMVASQSESDIYQALGLPYIEPELRENQGEIEAALRQGLRLSPSTVSSGRICSAERPQDKTLRQAQVFDFEVAQTRGGKPNGLPRLIGYNDIFGDLHCHSDWDGGRDSIVQIAQAAQNRSYQYIGIADHTKFLRIEHGLDEKQLLRQRKEIDKLNKAFSVQRLAFRILQGCEANVLNDGSIDIRDSVLAQLDFVIAGIHSNMKMSKSQMTQRMIRAMKNPNVDIISHPTGRILQRRDEYQIDFETVLKIAKDTGTILEINSFPERLDLKDDHIRRAKNQGVKMVINTDSHQKEQMRFMEFGVAQARRGWAEKKDIINCWPIEKLLTFFK